MNDYMKARVELSRIIREKEGIKGGKEGMKKIAQIITKALADAGVADYKTDENMSAAQAMQKALKKYKKD